MSQQSKLVFELCFTTKHFGSGQISTMVRVFDEKSYTACVMAVRNQMWGLVNRKNFYLRLVRGDVTVGPAVRFIDVTSYDSAVLSAVRLIEDLGMEIARTRV